MTEGIIQEEFRRFREAHTFKFKTKWYCATPKEWQEFEKKLIERVKERFNVHLHTCRCNECLDREWLIGDSKE